MSVTIARHALAAASALAGCCALAGCGGAPAALSAAPASAHSMAPARPSAVPAAVTHPPAQTPPPPAPPRVRIVRVRTTDGALVILATFLGPVRYVLHDGSGDPGPVAGLRAGPAVTGAERTQLLAAFNGGFKLAAGVGGYMQEGRVLSPLRRGLASLVIDRSGRARIGVWGSGVPVPGEAVYSVRQNLPPLVLDGRPTAAAADWGLWGATLGGGAYVARSAVGQDAAGHLIYAASMSAVPRRPGLRAGQPRRPDSDGTRHQPGVGPAGHHAQARRPADGRHTGPGPARRPVSRGLDQGFLHRPGRFQWF